MIFTISCLILIGGASDLCSCGLRHGGIGLYSGLDTVSASTFSGQRKLYFWPRIAIIVDHEKEPECFGSNFCFWR